MSRTKSEHNGYQDQEICELKDNYKSCATHIATTNEELGGVKIDVAIIKTKLSMHDKLLWIIISGVFGIIATMFAQMIFRIPV